MATVYKWEKYNVVTSINGTESGTETMVLQIPSSEAGTTYINYGYSLDDLTKSVAVSIIVSVRPTYVMYDGVVYKYSYLEVVGYARIYGYEVTITTSYSKGSTSYGQVYSEDSNAYPENGVQDGYWYVYVGSEETTGVFIAIDGVMTKLTTIPAMIDGVQRELDSLFATVDGVAREIFSSAVSVLPDGYTQLEYIRSSGTQFIDTGYKPNQNTRVVMDVDLISGTAYPTAFGAWDTDSVNSFIYVYIDATSGLYYYGNAYKSFSVSNGLGRHLVDANKNVLSLDGTVITTANACTFSCSYNVHLFAYDSRGTAENLTTMKLYSCQIYDDDTLVRDYVPCIDPNGAVGLYDLVTGEFYGNAGTGSFKTP